MISKVNGKDAATFEWDYDHALDVKLSGFRLYYSAPGSTQGMALTSSAPASRAVTVGIAFPFVGIYKFWVVAVANGTGVETPQSNVIEVEVHSAAVVPPPNPVALPAPTNFRVS